MQQEKTGKQRYRQRRRERKEKQTPQPSSLPSTPTSTSAPSLPPTPISPPPLPNDAIWPLMPLFHQILNYSPVLQVLTMPWSARKHIRSREPQASDKIPNPPLVDYFEDYSFLATFGVNQTEAHIRMGVFPGHIVRKFDSIYCAEQSNSGCLHRLVLVLASNGVFYALAYFPNKQDDAVYDNFLTEIDKRWQNIYDGYSAYVVR